MSFAFAHVSIDKNEGRSVSFAQGGRLGNNHEMVD
jgi:hypothetical protein